MEVKSVTRRFLFFFQAEDGIRDLVRSRGLGDVYKRQLSDWVWAECHDCNGAGTVEVAPGGATPTDTVQMLSLIHI